ncbi:MAG TPA: glutamate--cysteine ligase, partial [Acetobacteraceae bacterium]|nr:glutamate--cysteine ligase [Acetobacteraceae bacterium]
AAHALIRDISYDDLLTQRAEVPRLGLQTRHGKGTLRDLARQAVQIAVQGLKSRARTNGAGADERIYLEPLRAIAEGGPTQAEHWLARYHGAWRGNVTKIFAEAAF